MKSEIAKLGAIYTVVDSERQREDEPLSDAHTRRLEFLVFTVSLDPIVQPPFLESSVWGIETESAGRN